MGIIIIIIIIIMTIITKFNRYSKHDWKQYEHDTCSNEHGVCPLQCLCINTKHNKVRITQVNWAVDLNNKMPRYR